MLSAEEGSQCVAISSLPSCNSVIEHLLGMLEPSASTADYVGYRYPEVHKTMGHHVHAVDTSTSRHEWYTGKIQVNQVIKVFF